MTHKLHAKTLLLVVLVSVLTLTLAAAIFFSVDWQKKAVAEEIIVLPDNTAEYEFENLGCTDGNSKGTKFSYNVQNNEWSIKEGFYSTLEFKINVTKAGVVAFQWKLESSYDKECH